MIDYINVIFLVAICVISMRNSPIIRTRYKGQYRRVVFLTPEKYDEIRPSERDEERTAYITMDTSDLAKFGKVREVEFR